MNVLIADDETKMLKILKAYFQKEGFNVFLAEDGEEALDIFYSEKIDLAVLDWMMPKISGIDLCREIKEKSIAKVLMLTAKCENESELMALNLGADDYVKKPFDTRILIARSKKLLKECNSVYINDLKIDLESQKIFRDGKELNITNKEIKLMECFIKNKGIILSRQKLLDMVWGLDYYGDERTVDTHIRRLREKIGDNLIKTYRGIGYSLEEQGE
ncbi:response regulator transcription factor [Tepidibacter hydrothermalis]|uniref:Stage 0 sporulation protein A homolog n=1 Tax=Tepidibacter hydrothermalis TaxID=3036126 RepID=A0ABY8EE08_9FIRM|nr:response regulator transcription factor [Tepidibacter hydrothermalis]WFD11184.1 response regulator transcription factor [Tepidibacter hydrothermalis]